MNKSHLVRPSTLPWLRWLAIPIHEAELSWRFIAGDASSGIVPGMLFVLAAWIGHPTTPLPIALGRGIIYFWLYLYTFCLSNQLNGLNEDKRNKASRPLVEGLITQRQAEIRWIVVMVLFATLAWAFGVLIWALLWQLIIMLHNFGTWAKHWFTKNLAMAIGVTVQLAAAWQMIAPITSQEWHWIAVAACTIFILVTVQDLRDVEGDLAVGRKTFPIVYGKTITRAYLMFGFGVVAPLALQFAFLQSGIPSLPAQIYDGLLVLLCLVIAWRVFRYRTTYADHATYVLFTYWYCLFVASIMSI